ncbi:hypothetical protein C0991_005137, partial [Blastosporella zonata]
MQPLRLPGGPLEAICAEYLKLRNLRDLNKPENIPRLRLFLKGVKVEVSELPGHQNKRAKTVKDILSNVADIRFEKDGESITIREHFDRAHLFTVRSNSLGVKLGNDGIFPMHACRTIEQLYRNRSSPDVVREALEFSPKTPAARMEAITVSWQQLQYSQSSFLRGAGISVNPQALTVRGRLLPSPVLTFGNKASLTPQRPGTWDMLQKTFTEPASLGPWTVVDLAQAAPNTLTRNET